MNGATDWKQTSVDALFILAEAVAWYIMLHVGATALEQAYLAQLDDRIRLALTATDLADASRAADALSLIQRASLVERGPGLLVVLVTAFGGFALMRGLMRARFEGVLGAVVLIASSILALNVLLHLALSGDIRVWDPSRIALFVTDSEGFAGRTDLGAFIRRPDLDRAHGPTISFTFVSMTALWVRFIIAGRGRVTFERVLRSFTAGFVFTIVGLAFAAMEGVHRVQLFAVPQFIFGILALAVANNARAAAPIDGVRRTGPWFAAVGGTVAVLLGVALLMGTLAFLNVGVLLSAIGEIAWTVIAFLLILIITPVYWVIEHIVRLLLPNGLVGLPPLPNMQFGPPEPGDAAKNAAGWSVPLWAQNGLKFLAVLIILYVIYRVAIVLMRRRRMLAGAVDEVRGQASSSIGLGALLRGMLPGVRRSSGDDWIRRQPIYRLYARAARAAEERGFRYLSGETPLEFASRADRAMNAPPYPPISLAFDRARYGRHFPEDGQVRSLEAALAAWESATPPTEELRHRLAGAAPLTDAQEFLLTVAARRRVIARSRPRPRGAEDIEEPRPPPTI